ncbi:MAG: glycosyltransferase family protein [Desulfomonile tiedjei]|nr:glycosyltransferase family protein [Desulfomonile tiedjei]
MAIPIIIQARTGSQRLPRKVLAELANGTVLEYVIRRCRQSRLGSNVIVATSVLPRDDAVEALSVSLGVPVFRGSEDDVLSRYIDTARAFRANVLIRITADCPLIDPSVIDKVIGIYRLGPVDYITVEGYPVGLGDVELATLPALERCLAETSPAETYYREHVATYISTHPDRFHSRSESPPPALKKPEIHLAVDEPGDLEIVRRICEYFSPRLDFRTAEILAFLEEHPDLLASSMRRSQHP